MKKLILAIMVLLAVTFVAAQLPACADIPCDIQTGYGLQRGDGLSPIDLGEGDYVTCSYVNPDCDKCVPSGEDPQQNQWDDEWWDYTWEEYGYCATASEPPVTPEMTFVGIIGLLAVVAVITFLLIKKQ